jgi:hypothetical protein
MKLEIHAIDAPSPDASFAARERARERVAKVVGETTRLLGMELSPELQRHLADAYASAYEGYIVHVALVHRLKENKEAEGDA